MHRNIGKFVISNAMIQNTGCHKMLMKLMGRMIIVRAEQQYGIDGIEYIAISDYFVSVAEGETIPKYHFIIESDAIRCEAIK